MNSSDSTPGAGQAADEVMVFPAYPGSAMQRTYDSWIGHAVRCAECRAGYTAANGCPVGKELWAAYASARSEAGMSEVPRGS